MVRSSASGRTLTYVKPTEQDLKRAEFTALLLCPTSKFPAPSISYRSRGVDIGTTTPVLMQARTIQPMSYLVYMFWSCRTVLPVHREGNDRCRVFQVRKLSAVDVSINFHFVGSLNITGIAAYRSGENSTVSMLQCKELMRGSYRCLENDKQVCFIVCIKSLTVSTQILCAIRTSEPRTVNALQTAVAKRCGMYNEGQIFCV